jgi:hypothetical protein
VSGPAPITRAGAQRAAAHELSKSIYHRQSEPLAERAVRAVGRLVDRGLDKALSHGTASGIGGLALVVIIVALVALVVWRTGPPARGTRAGVVLPVGRTTTAAEHRALAQAATDAGDWNRAVLEWMRAIARDLEERGVIDPRPGRTASELAGEAGGILPDTHAALRDAARAFNDVAYGGLAAEPPTVALMAAADGQLRRASRATAGVT